MNVRVGKHLLFSCVLHVLLLSFLIFSFEWASKTPVLENTQRNDPVISAVVTTLPEKVITPTPIPVPPKPISPEPVKPVPPVKPLMKPLVATLPKKVAVIIPDKKQKIKPEKKPVEKPLTNVKKQTEKTKKIQHKELVSEFEKEMKNLTAKSLQQQMLQEEKRLAGEKNQQMQGEINKYKALILQSISQHWLVPASVNKTLSAQLMIRVAADGQVLDVQLIKSSGDPTLDRSARAAVFKASPLPVPKETAAFAPFKQFVLKLKPENLLDNISVKG